MQQPEVPVAQEASIATAKIGPVRFRPSPATEFKPGNPGKPKGTKNYSTRVRDLLVSSVNRDTIRIFRKRLRRPDNRQEFDKALDQVICLLGPGKPLVAIDASQHTHFTVVLDQPPQA